MLPAPWGGETYGYLRTMSVPRPLAPAVAVILAAILLAACGSTADPQDANEPEGDYQVEVTTSEFPTRQRLGESNNLVLGVSNTGTETLPMLAFTVFIGDGTADGSFNIRSDQPGLENPNRPVWVLENKYPQLAGEPPPSGISGGTRAQTNTFAFGPLDPGETQEAIWRLTAVKAGTYTLSYTIAAGLDGNAKAVTSSGQQVKGKFVVKLLEKPPQARVNNRGKVVTQG